ncbi:hypothetical protein SRHO_G00228780 [Serrasalmus rhombeus]
MPQNGDTHTQAHSSGMTVQLQEPGSQCYMRTHRPHYSRTKIKVYTPFEEGERGRDGNLRSDIVSRALIAARFKPGEPPRSCVSRMSASPNGSRHTEKLESDVAPLLMRDGLKLVAGPQGRFGARTCLQH